MKKKIPCTIKPCSNCPFRKDTLKGWLRKGRITEILEADSFVCHKDTSLQCSGHMLLTGSQNIFYRFMKFFGAGELLKGKELVFENKEQCIKHHANE